MPPGPGAGRNARAALIPWFTERPEVLAEEYTIHRDTTVIDLNEPIAYAGTLKSATEKAQEWVAEHGIPVIIAHQSWVRVAVVGKEPPQ